MIGESETNYLDIPHDLMREYPISRVSLRLQRISEVLLLNSNLLDNSGLLNGRIGISIFFYHYSRFTAEEIYESYAGELVDAVYAEIDSQTPIDFVNGLTGIGWATEYLVQNGFVEGDTNEVLENIDYKVGQSLLDHSLTESINHVIGFGFYYLSRYKGQSVHGDNPFFLSVKRQLSVVAEICVKLINRRTNPEILFSNIGTLNLLIHLIIEIEQLGLMRERHMIFDHLVLYIENMLIRKDSVMQEIRLLQFQAERIVSIISDRELIIRYQGIVALIERHISMRTENVIETVDNFVLASIHSLLYGIGIERFHKEYSKYYHRVASVICDENNWNIHLSRRNRGTLGLANLTGLALALLNSEYYEAG